MLELVDGECFGLVCIHRITDFGLRSVGGGFSCVAELQYNAVKSSTLDQRCYDKIRHDLGIPQILIYFENDSGSRKFNVCLQCE